MSPRTCLEGMIEASKYSHLISHFSLFETHQELSQSEKAIINRWLVNFFLRLSGMLSANASLRERREILNEQRI